MTHLVKDRYVLDPLYADDESPFYDPEAYSNPMGYPCTPIIRLAVEEHSLLLWERISGEKLPWWRIKAPYVMMC